MFEAAELGHEVSKERFDAIEPQLRLELLELQQKLRRAGFPVIVVFGGVDGAGKGETVNDLHGWLDPRWLVTRAYTAPSEEEAERPEFWRYWRDLPPKGKIGFFLSAWYSQPLLDRVYGRSSVAELDQRLSRIAAFEKMLVDDGALILKFWMHLGKRAQRRRLKALEKDPLQHWRVTKSDWRHYRMYDDFAAAAERAIMRTSTGRAPWHIVEGVDARYRYLTVATTIRDAVVKHLRGEQLRAEIEQQTARAREEQREEEDAAPTADVESGGQQTILQSLDMDQRLAKKAYRTALRRQQARLNQLFRRARKEKLSVLLVFEGWDAAGKGGSIRRLTAALDARSYQVIPIAAPSDEERAQHYLWRFWRHLSRAGRVTVFDRSWYGRVLVERVEGFASEAEWMRAYGEINNFEETLVEHGCVLVKYWLNITKDEQLGRFQARQETPFKRWKLTDEDWRNREQWESYEAAVNEMIARTSTRIAPWTLVEANCKRFARVKVIRTLCDSLERALGARGKQGKRRKRKGKRREK